MIAGSHAGSRGGEFCVDKDMFHVHTERRIVTLLPQDATYRDKGALKTFKNSSCDLWFKQEK